MANAEIQCFALATASTSSSVSTVIITPTDDSIEQDTSLHIRLGLSRESSSGKPRPLRSKYTSTIPFNLKNPLEGLEHGITWPPLIEQDRKALCIPSQDRASATLRRKECVNFLKHRTKERLAEKRLEENMAAAVDWVDKMVEPPREKICCARMNTEVFERGPREIRHPVVYLAASKAPDCPCYATA